MDSIHEKHMNAIIELRDLMKKHDMEFSAGSFIDVMVRLKKGHPNARDFVPLDENDLKNHEALSRFIEKHRQIEVEDGSSD